MTAATEDRNPENDSASSKSEKTESQQGRPRRAGRGRRNSRGQNRRRGNTSERGADKEQERRQGSKSASAKSGGEGRRRQGNRKRGSKTAEEGGGRNRRRGQSGGNRNRRGTGKQDSHLRKQKEAMAPDPTYVEPGTVFIHQYTRLPSSRDYDTGMGQRPNWFVRWEKDFDQGYEH